ncbi:hypothetical protein IFM89_026641 [Coptis chinensis]|uniref:Uncharacterized protein n=1 Tax=Coptis chinensis TaxID=261450 RepID=A0A835GZI4_9MAGN|nr:hypothetical protein IFM89_026641 [Coptis chinensis]
MYIGQISQIHPQWILWRPVPVRHGHGRALPEEVRLRGVQRLDRGFVGMERADGAGECGKASPNNVALKLAPCASAAQDANAAVSDVNMRVRDEPEVSMQFLRTKMPAEDTGLYPFGESMEDVMMCRRRVSAICGAFYE